MIKLSMIGALIKEDETILLGDWSNQNRVHLPIDQFDSTGKYIGTWPSKTFAARSLGITATGFLSRGVSINGEPANGYIWKQASECRSLPQKARLKCLDYSPEIVKCFEDDLKKIEPLITAKARSYRLSSLFFDDFCQEARVLLYTQYYEWLAINDLCIEQWANVRIKSAMVSYINKTRIFDKTISFIDLQEYFLRGEIDASLEDDMIDCLMKTVVRLEKKQLILVDLVLQGLTNNEIENRLGITPSVLRNRMMDLRSRIVHQWKKAYGKLPMKIIYSMNSTPVLRVDHWGNRKQYESLRDVSESGFTKAKVCTAIKEKSKYRGFFWEYVADASVIELSQFSEQEAA